MSKITLTDRISVSVRAKTDTQSSQQKVDTGKNIANALGVDDYNDTDAATIGNTSKPTITDENGNEWVSMQDIIDAGKKMNQDGAFEEKTEYTYNNKKFQRVSRVEVWNDSVYSPTGITQRQVYSGDMYFSAYVNKNKVTFIVYSTSFTKDITVTSFTDNGNINSTSLTDGEMTSKDHVEPNIIYQPNEFSDFGTIETAISKGATPKISGGSIIDWTKPDDEIEEDIRQLHETWDVSEHEGAVTANGTYVLAGPIEYNDADPDSHSSGDF